MTQFELEIARAVVAWFVMLWLPTIVGLLVLKEALGPHPRGKSRTLRLPFG